MPASAEERLLRLTPTFSCVFRVFASFDDVVLNIFAASFQLFCEVSKPSKSLFTWERSEVSKPSSEEKTEEVGNRRRPPPGFDLIPDCPRATSDMYDYGLKLSHEGGRSS